MRAKVVADIQFGYERRLRGAAVDAFVIATIGDGDAQSWITRPWLSVSGGCVVAVTG